MYYIPHHFKTFKLSGHLIVIVFIKRSVPFPDSLNVFTSLSCFHLWQFCNLLAIYTFTQLTQHSISCNFFIIFKGV